MSRIDGMLTKLGVWIGVALVGATAGWGQAGPAQTADPKDSGLPVVELKPQEVNLWDHRVRPDTAIHLTATEYQEAMTKSRLFIAHSYVEFEIVVSENGRVDSAKLVSDAHGREDEARAIEMAREFKPWMRDGTLIRVRVRDTVSLLPPERWADVHVPFPQEWDAKTTSVGLKRTVCYGSCPEYEVTVSGDGTVRYSGRIAVAITGDHVAHISPDAARELVLEFKTADFLSAKDEYRGNWTDNPTQTLTLTIAGKTKTVVDYVGTDAGLPLAIRNLEAEIDEVAGTARWVKGNGALLSLEEEKWPFASASPQNVELYATAIAMKNEPLIERYLVTRGPIVSADTSQASPVCVASAAGDLTLVERMMKPVAAKDGIEKKDRVPVEAAQQCLWSAAFSGNVAMLQYWLDAGADPKVQAPPVKQNYLSGMSILANGVMSRRADMVRKLLEYKLNVNMRVQDFTLLSFALGKPGPETPEIIELLVKAGADVNARSNGGDGGGPPIYAAEFAPAAVKTLLAAGADIEARIWSGDTPLIRFAYNEGMVKELLADGADPTATNKQGETALKIAKQSCQSCAAMIEEALKQRGANVEAPMSAP